MECGKRGGLGKRFIAAALIGLAGGLLARLPVSAQQIHRNGFEGRQTAWVRGEDNVRSEEKVHQLSIEYSHLGTTSEFIQLICPEAKNENNYASYYYPSQPAPVVEDLTASVWVKANRAGVQLQARLVLPRERNPRQLDEPMTVMLTGDSYKLTRKWQKLELSNPVKLMKDQQQLLRAQFRRDLDLTDAYIDRLVLNLYTGPGQIDVYIDDLEIGPVRGAQPPVPVSPAAQPKVSAPVARNDRGVLVRMEQDKLFVGGKPFFFRAIRYSDTPLKTLRDAGFNTVWFDPNVPVEQIEESVSHGFWIVPRLPLVGDQKPPTTLTGRGGSDLATARDVEGLATAITRFMSGDAVLFWDLGGALQAERGPSLERTAKAISLADPNRPRGADVWDGFRDLSHHVEMVGTHRFPLMSSLELTSYRDWLMQRRRLTIGNALHWTWVQTHIPEWQMKLVYGDKRASEITEPIGPQPEQIRLLTYLGLAAGVRGLAFSSDRFLADSHQGRDRLLMLALLNQEIQMLEPILLSLRESPIWIDTSHPSVKAAVLRSDKGVLVLPIWLGDGAQYVPPQGSVANLSMNVPLIPDGSQPWEITPARVQSLQFNSKREISGTRITLPEFDLTSAIVFTSDLSPNSLVVKCQNHSRLIAPQAAQWSRDLATIQLKKVRQTHAELTAVAPPVLNADRLLREAEERLASAVALERSRDYVNAHLEAMRSMRPLRILMRAHWQQAVRTLDLPTASPYATTFFTLPQHWQLHRELRGTTLGANALKDGDFEIAANHPEFAVAARKVAEDRPVTDVISTQSRKIEGAPVSSLPGWTLQQQTIDAVELEAMMLPAKVATPLKPVKGPKPKRPYDPSTGVVELPDPPEPKLGNSVLKLEIRPKVVINPKDGKALPIPAALERTYLAVTTPTVRLQPGTWVRISGWVMIPKAIESSADGFLLFDNIGDEAMGVRMTAGLSWKKFHLYRQVPASGAVWVTAALTGIGTVYVDDIRVEPLLRTVSGYPEEREGITPVSFPK